MKKAAFAAIAGLALTQSLLAAPPAPANVPLYRLVSSGGDHLYTASASERDQAIKADGYRSEGVLGYVWDKKVPATEPLYRLYKGSKSRHDHFYTANPAERQQAESRDGYKAEGITGYIAKTQLPGTVPLYRLYSERSGEHFYTASEKEREFAEKNDGFKSEGIVGYVAPPPPAKAVQPVAHPARKR
jgi:hypothetical protein